MIKWHIFLPFLLLFAACGSGGAEKKQLAQLRSEVIAIHDEVMPRMGEIKSLSRKIMHERDSLKTANSADSARLKALETALRNLKTADKGMWDWMHRFHKADTEAAEKAVHAVYMEMLEKEKVAITGVKAAMLQSIEEAHQLYPTTEKP